YYCQSFLVNILLSEFACEHTNVRVCWWIYHCQSLLVNTLLSEFACEHTNVRVCL
ncbi:predicted protein, partial [Nematostella vectensis]